MATSFAAGGTSTTTPDVSGFDLSDIVRDAQSNGCECDVCESVRALAETRRLQGSRWKPFRWGIIVAAGAAVTSATISLIDLAVDVL